MEPIMLIHGGADDVPEEMIGFKVEGVKKACNVGFNILKHAGSALDAVEAAINSMEDDEHFNAGRGSVLNEEGEVEMDAGIMVGKDLSTGGVTAVREISHPISLARIVMEKTPHVLLAGEGANRLAHKLGVPRVPNIELITEFAKADLALTKKQLCASQPLLIRERCDTVGAVAMDRHGRTVAGTSTGGLTGKMVGRSSDSSKAGCGFYADDRFGGVSVTGHGESIVKVCLSHSIINELKNGKTPQEAAQSCVSQIQDQFGKHTGAVVLSKSGDIGIFNTSYRMPWAYIKEKKVHYGATSGEKHEEQCHC